MFWGGHGGGCRGGPHCPHHPQQWQRDEGHHIRLLQGLVAPVISFLCPNLTYLPPAGVCCLRLASLRVAWGQGTSCHCPHGFYHYPCGPCQCSQGSCHHPHGSCHHPLSPAIIPVGFADVCHHPHGSYWCPQGSYHHSYASYQHPHGSCHCPHGSCQSLHQSFPCSHGLSPCPSRVVPLFLHLLPQNSSVGL